MHDEAAYRLTEEQRVKRQLLQEALGPLFLKAMCEEKSRVLEGGKVYYSLGCVIDSLYERLERKA